MGSFIGEEPLSTRYPPSSKASTKKGLKLAKSAAFIHFDSLPGTNFGTSQPFGSKASVMPRPYPRIESRHCLI